VLAADQDIADSYTNVSALGEQLREAAETVAAFIVRRMQSGCRVDQAPTKSGHRHSWSRLIPIDQSEPGLRGDCQIPTCRADLAR